MADLIKTRSDARKRLFNLEKGSPRSLTAAASIMVPTANLKLHAYPWQNILWDFYRDGVGAFKFGARWHAQMMSKIRLVAAIQHMDAEDPEIITEGPVAEAVHNFFGGILGQSEYFHDIDLQMQIPGEGYVVCKGGSPDGYEWCVKSKSEIDTQYSNDGTLRWKIRVDDSTWETLPPDSYVFRQWFKDPEKSWRPDSPARGALTELRLIDIIEKRLMAQGVSRLAMNGFLLYSGDITWPTNSKYKDAPDPFLAELLDAASEVIANPTSALAAMPLPIRLPGEHFDKFKHLPFANPYDEKSIEILDGLYDKLAAALNMPKEILQGMGSTSHWNAWTLTEEGVETHIKPDAATYCGGITKSYLHPWLKTINHPLKDPNGGDYIVWFDTSKLDTPPDLSKAADDAYDRKEISSNTYRIAKGFSDQDKPDDADLLRHLLIDAVSKDPSMLESVVDILTGYDISIIREARAVDADDPGALIPENVQPTGPAGQSRRPTKKGSTRSDAAGKVPPRPSEHEESENEDQERFRRL